MKIGEFDLAQDVLVIAEIGNNHEGNYSLAEDMIGLAAEAGAGAVKFQTMVPEKLVSIKQKDRIEQLRKFQFSYYQFEKLCQVARQNNIMFLSTPFDLESAQFLNSLVPAFKIASGDNNFFPMIKVIAETGKAIILSAGLTDLQQINQTKEFIERIWSSKDIIQELAILHCIVSYPTSLQEANLQSISQLRKLGTTVGYSDHTLGIEAAVLSVALGARIIEKHFTIDKHYSDFRDHQLSADPKEFANLVKRVREVQEMLGINEKKVMNTEKANLENVRRSIVASRDLKQGNILKWEDLNWVRPGGGFQPGQEKDIIGKILIRSVKQGEILRNEDFR